jgi:CheY-like chemotaxis protein
MRPEHGRPSHIEPTTYVLVVDDEACVRELVTEVLELEGFKVVAVENGMQALDYLKAHPSPSCILLDHDMPEMNGAQFRKAQQCFPDLKDIPVILVTATRNIERKADELQVKGHLQKPFDIDRLVEIVSTCPLQERVV